MITRDDDDDDVKNCALGQPHVLFVLCLFVILVVSHFYFEGRIFVVIAPVPGHLRENVVAVCKWLDASLTGVVERKGGNA